MTRQGLIRAFFLLCVAAYPFIIFFGLSYLPPSAFGLALLVLLALRFGVLLPDERPILLPALVIYVIYAATATISQSQMLLLYYPAVVNLTLGGVFLNSLRSGDPLLLRIIRARGTTMTVHAPSYLYWLTGIWAAFFIVNAAISIWTSTQSLEIWTLYNGFLAYIAIGVLAAGEFVFRYFYKRRMGVSDS